MAKQVEINTVRPLWQIVDDSFLMKTGSYAYFYELNLNPIYTLDESDYDRIINDFSRIFNLLPDFTVVHKLDIFTNKSFIVNNPLDDENLLLSSYFKKHLERPFMEHKSYLFVSKTHSGFTKQSSLSSLFFKRNFLPKELIRESRLSRI